MKILIKRTGALGDVILTTPIVRRLKRENRDAEIIAQTGYPAVFKCNPHVSHVVEPGQRLYWEFGQTVDLDLSYERRPSMHIVDAYMEEAFGDRGFSIASKRQELFFNTKPLFPLPNRYVAVHAAHAGWRNRTLPKATWIAVIEGLLKNDLCPILVGTERDGIDGIATSCLVPDIHVQARLIASCACFVGSDSSLLHVAGATDTPIVGIFTSVKPDYRLPYRENCTAVVPPGLDCLGCQERASAPSTVESCERGDVACVQAVRAEDIVNAVVSAIKGAEAFQDTT